MARPAAPTGLQSHLATRTRLTLLAAVLLLAACGPVYWMEWQSPLGRSHPLAGRVWDVAAGRFVEPRDLLERLAARRFVLLGERHDNPDHHALQERVVRALIAAGRRPAIGFEMLSTDDAPALARYLAQSPKSAAGLGDAVGWQRSGWPPWRLYAPIAQAALDAGLPLVAANLSRPATDAVRKHGLTGLGPALAGELALTEPSPATRAAIAREIQESHCGQAPERLLDRMVDVQWARDARLAASLARAGQRDGAVLIAGAGHVRRDHGVPVHLARQAPGASVASVAFIEVDAGVTAPAAYAARFGDGTLPLDYAWFTARVDDVDPCEKYKQDLERLRRR
jgi:uncharacterized iron-regulated protein